MTEEGGHPAREVRPSDPGPTTLGAVSGSVTAGGPQTGGFDGSRGRVEWEADERGLLLRERRRERRFGWDAVTRAGLMELSTGVTRGVLPLLRLPGFRRLVGYTVLRSMEWRQLLLATGTAPSSIYRLAIPVGDPGADGLIDTIRDGVGERWVGEVTTEEHYEALGIRTPWYYTPLILGAAVIAALVVLLLGGLVYAGVTAVVGEVPTVAWIGLLTVLLVGNQLWRKFRRR